MGEPLWITEARAHIGLREIKGPQHAPAIVRMWKAIRRGGIKDDETPWCAAFVGSCLEAAGLVSSRSEAARSYMTWGIPLATPRYGCVAVFSRAGGGGHVGFVVGQNADGSLAILGGNQGDAVNIRTFPADRVIGYRWPEVVPVPNAILAGVSAENTTGEA